MLIAMMLQLPFLTKGQFNRDMAKDLVLNRILAADTGHIDVYAALDSVPYGDSINLIDGTTISAPFPYNWVFFSNDHPNVAWFHPCRYVIINTSNGDYAIDSSQFYPRILTTGYEVILQESKFSGIPVPPCQDSDPTYASPNPHLHALLIGGTDDATFNGQNIMWDDDLSVIYNTLLEKGYEKDNITVLDYDGELGHINWGGDLNNDGQSDINGGAFRSIINNTFDSYLPGGSRALNQEDQLFVYATDHGTFDNTLTGKISALCLPSESGTAFYHYSSTEMMQRVQQINCAQMIFVIHCCFSETFGDLANDPNAVTKNRIVLPACKIDEGTAFEIFMTNYGYLEETYYLSAALRGYYPGTVPWKWGCRVGEFPFLTWYQPTPPGNWYGLGHPADYNPDSGSPSGYSGLPPITPAIPGNNDGFTQIIEAFNYANCMDTYSPNGYFNTGGHFAPATPLYVINNGFSNDDLFCLNGIAGNTSSNLPTAQAVESRSYLLGGNLNVHSPLTIGANSTFTMGVVPSIISVDEGSSFMAGSNLIINGISNSSTGIYIHNTGNELSLDQAQFSGAFLNNNGDKLTITHNSSFLNTIVESHRGKVKIDGTSSFTNTPLRLDDHDQSSTSEATIDNCTFLV